MSLQLNNISSSQGSRCLKKRVGRGIGSGLGKTGGRGHKGQKSRSGCKIGVTFEGGQTALHRRLPKFGFTSKKKMMTKAITLLDLSRISENLIDLNVLRKNNIIGNKIRFVKIIMSGKINRAVVIRNIRISKGAKTLIQVAGGRIEREENSK
ncbi:50S ribosomal protein L15 [Candidatus Blochmanniella vafra str. BVAF]|uniref:Large ribosomal subunit protein uL15 n=1 Tax=Blochmanniella vafra (strain BVAF) TaxID=859654 RepID=E8Q5Z6_BLOVB|nr:50S ribosomal protein L15 [Candidatus Blochmannia vafer]ADV33612.1 50S ribosomal protein L15 [Candidatus Blochmannia vafer str. BVAF]